jgi:hypothetical protein
LKRAASLLLAATFSVSITSSATDAVPPVAQKFYTLFDELRAAQDAKAKGINKPVNFSLTEREINDYMVYSLRTTPRPGLQSVTLKFFPDNYVSAFTVIDFDAVEKWKPGTIPALLKPVLSGKKSVWVDYRFQTVNGQASFSVEKAYYNDVRIPAFVVQRAIHLVAARQPEKYDTDKPLPLPFGLRKVWTAEHQVSGTN